MVPETRGLPLEEVHLAWGTHWLWGRLRCVRSRGGGGLELMGDGGGGKRGSGKCRGGEKEEEIVVAGGHI